MAIEEGLQLAQPENVVARRIFRQAAFHKIFRKIACRLRRSFGGRDEIVFFQPFDDALQGIAALGVDYVSSGALTHSAGILDLSMKHLKVFD